MAADEIYAFREGDSAFIADARHFPLVVVTWFGTMTEHLLVDYFRWQAPILQRAIDERTKFAFVVDCTRAGRPSPKLRKLTAELSDQGPDASKYALPTFTAIESALVRGAITAMQWVTSVDWKIVTVATARQGVQRAIAALVAEGVAAPRGITADTYEPPEMPASSTRGVG